MDTFCPIPLGSTVLIESTLDKEEGKKKFILCSVTSTDGSRVYTEATGNFPQCLFHFCHAAYCIFTLLLVFIFSLQRCLCQSVSATYCEDDTNMPSWHQAQRP
ncbi:hypothetical protein ILYODFUR_030462 [Ilyodon furcidens]|uniref:Uncharacterized protein n=1 Tax=Ilyodon furcidens TaxID=33524 RepID=A0ABV0U1S9_9TELE